ncbi:hypothetical protein [Pseudomonas gessardii]|jgi:hypothetical protein|uniref:Uncharacterized protein n=1 Tax=Pseudomonas gessardii TaxID=78544 RepID=A0A7Y1MRJ5_9PSED|nr:hypothetical protein [Pseudomonas gessardii]NNA96953.1 hypothetical protein [Pseudomonas gessardii]OPK02989.1 hypothetical protein CP11 [Pseudomonas veronii]
MQTDHGSFQTVPADAEFDMSAIAHAFRAGVNATELDALAQVINRLARDGSTVAPASLEADLKGIRELGYIALSSPINEKLTVTLLCPGALLSSYFWSVWIPRHLLDRSLKATVRPLLNPSTRTQHCTVVFRIPSGREIARQFLTDISAKFPGLEPEIIAIKMGNALGGEK